MTSPTSATIDATGISVPTYAEILTYLQNQFYAIYGSDSYLQPDSQDGQWIAVMAAALNDNNAMAIAVYNAFSPSTAQGVGLSSVVKINGIMRMSSSNSTVLVTITGTVGTVINNGIVGDPNGNRWDLPAQVIIPGGGTILVTATAEETGNIALGNTVTLSIVTATLGWLSAVTAAQAAPGSPVESDATLRVRQSNSTALPSQTVNAGLYGAIDGIPGVTQLALYENFTDSTDSNGLLAHSIALVVEGGDATTIAQTIALKKSEGCNTNGTTSEVVLDQITGLPTTVKFYIPTQIAMHLVVNVKTLTNYVSSTGTAILASLAAFINAIGIGGTDYNSKLVGAADDSGLGATFNVLSIFQARSDMTITGGPYNAGATVINVTNPADIAIGSKLALVLDNGVFWYVTASGVAGTAVTFAPAIPTSRHTSNGALVYVEGDIVSAFNELLTSLTTDMTLVTS